MDFFKNSNGGKKNILVKAWEKCSLRKSKSLHSGSAGVFSKKEGKGKAKLKGKVAPEGCFSVYVGVEKQRFAIKAKYANHPLFELLLEDAESEYGYNSDGPISLPCEVDLFYKVLEEMETSGKQTYPHHHGSACGFGYSSCTPFNPSYRLGNSDMAKGYGQSFELLMLRVDLKQLRTHIFSQLGAQI